MGTPSLSRTSTWNFFTDCSKSGSVVSGRSTFSTEYTRASGATKLGKLGVSCARDPAENAVSSGPRPRHRREAAGDVGGGLDAGLRPHHTGTAGERTKPCESHTCGSPTVPRRVGHVIPLTGGRSREDVTMQHLLTSVNSVGAGTQAAGVSLRTTFAKVYWKRMHPHPATRAAR